VSRWRLNLEKPSVPRSREIFLAQRPCRCIRCRGRQWCYPRNKRSTLEYNRRLIRDERIIPTTSVPSRWGGDYMLASHHKLCTGLHTGVSLRVRRRRRFWRISRSIPV